ncbi:MAG: 3-hydroxybutyrate dehydrogenase [Proteobacteria bacterium]|nr:3-hydroxybutyrate dehydrogenase [Pseudomonadota bacterium]
MLSGKTALVTGSTSGIGLGVATELAKNNANIILNGFGPLTEIAGLVNHLSTLTTGKVIHCAANLIEIHDIEQLVQFSFSTFGTIDILVNNAGIQYVSPIETFPVEKWNHIIALNLSSSFHTIRLTLEKMKEKGWGRIINIVSTHGLVASPGKAAYVAAKHGLLGLTKVVALETSKENITCNAICPGWVLTPLVEQQIQQKAEKQKISFDEAKDELLAEKQPSKQFVTPEQIGRTCVFLCSEAAHQMTGSNVVMDGGWTAQ